MLSCAARDKAHTPTPGNAARRPPATSPLSHTRPIHHLRPGRADISHPGSHFLGREGCGGGDNYASELCDIVSQSQDDYEEGGRRDRGARTETEAGTAAPGECRELGGR